MIATEFVQPPRKEEPVDTLQPLSYCDAADHSFADSDASTYPSLSSSDHDDFSDLVESGTPVTPPTSGPTIAASSSVGSSSLTENRRQILLPPTIPENKRSPFQIDRGSQKEHEQEGLIADGPEGEVLVVPDGVRIGEIPATEMALSEMRTRQSSNVEEKGSCGRGGRPSWDWDWATIVTSGRCLVKASLGCNNCSRQYSL